jgi:uncharacterized protein
MILVDTGYFLAFVNPDDQHHARAMAWSKAPNDRLLVTEYVLWETINALSGRRYRPHAHAIADSVVSRRRFQFVEARPDLLRFGLRIHRRHRDKNWSLTDCISFHVMRQQGILRALAFDHHFEQAGFEALLRRDPP